MSTAVRFTVEEFDRMAEKGIFDDPNRRFELVFGEILEMVHPGPLHEDIVDLLEQWSHAVVDAKKVRVRVEKTLGIPELDSVPRPDIGWVRQQSYRSARPKVKDVLLIVEVADTTLAFDRKVKRKLYAQAGVREYWIVNARSQAIEVFRNPAGDNYETRLRFEIGESVSPLALPSAKLPVKMLFQS
jgi:Uma2 family endonuclease